MWKSVHSDVKYEQNWGQIKEWTVLKTIELYWLHMSSIQLVHFYFLETKLCNHIYWLHHILLYKSYLLIASYISSILKAFESRNMQKILYRNIRYFCLTFICNLCHLLNIWFSQGAETIETSDIEKIFASIFLPPSCAFFWGLSAIIVRFFGLLLKEKYA